VENLNINPNESIYVGDTLADFKASNLAGMDFALAVWGASDLEGIKANVELQTPKDLLTVFDK
ncbi:MAG: HAD family hydrolase, partial [Clostridium sp.]|uniref:HAD family hydrolase n=1 Tax=Clostridium sp. TaxID=1506 RepID=UPI003F3F1A89